MAAFTPRKNIPPAPRPTIRIPSKFTSSSPTSKSPQSSNESFRSRIPPPPPPSRSKSPPPPSRSKSPPPPSRSKSPSSPPSSRFKSSSSQLSPSKSSLSEAPDSPVEQFIQTVITEQDADISQDKEYLGYIQYLLNQENKYDIFSRLFPDHTCPGILFRMTTPHSKTPTIFPNQALLSECLMHKEMASKSLALNFSYENHANLIWIDPVNRIINRYDPQVSGQDPNQSQMDETLRQYWSKYLPDYLYLGNNLEVWQCVQEVRSVGRTYKSDYFCQDYSLLYAINRLRGLSHEEAAWDLVSREDILEDLADLLRALAYRIRSELGKPVPKQYLKWAETQLSSIR